MIEENVARVREAMAEAALAAGRRPETVALCAATKMNDAEAVRRAVAAGVDCCGENRVQELLLKLPLRAYEGAPVHFIGNLQTNKVGKVVGRVDLIQSVDRPELLACLEKEAAKQNLTQNILIEVNVGGEASKSGFTVESARRIVGELGKYPHIFLRGFMTVPPVSVHRGDNRKFFAEMRRLYVDIKAKRYDNVYMEYLSMGMSDDFEDAIAEGSTMVRIGSAIFGPRHYA